MQLTNIIVNNHLPIINSDTPNKRPDPTEQEEKKMPWYMNPVKTCKVLNRIANRHRRAPLHDLTAVLDQVTEKLWNKQERYYSKKTSR